MPLCRVPLNTFTLLVKADMLKVVFMNVEVIQCQSTSQTQRTGGGNNINITLWLLSDLPILDVKVLYGVAN